MTPILLTRIIEALAVLSLPFVAWLGLCLAIRYQRVGRDRALVWIRTARWVSGLLGAALLIANLVNGSVSAWCWNACLVFSIGLAFPELRLRRELHS